MKCVCVRERERALRNTKTIALKAEVQRMKVRIKYYS